MNIKSENKAISTKDKNARTNVVSIIGIIMVAIGIFVIADQFLKTNWLPLALAPLFGIYFLVEAIRTRQFAYLITSGLLLGAGAGGFIGFSPLFVRPLAHDFGWLVIFFALGWALIAILSEQVTEKPAWWALVPAGIIFSIGLTLLMTEMGILDFVLWVGTGTGIVLLLWGIYGKLFGLIIPGSLLVTTAPGIYLAWGRPLQLNSLAKTGLMIAIISLGWFIIILFSRVTTSKFIWWPLIPGGILAMVGWGLYIGGDPATAPRIIANTGSIGLIIFGIYLLLLRKGIHR